MGSYSYRVEASRASSNGAPNKRVPRQGEHAAALERGSDGFTEKEGEGEGDGRGR